MPASSFTPEVLVTGGAGFIGSHLVDVLVESGRTVRVLENFRNGKREHLTRAMATGLVELVEGDITDLETCRKAIQGVSVVFHMACLGVRHSLHSPFENHQVNALGTLQLLEMARQAKTRRFIYMSTSEVYGATPVFPLTETSSTHPTTVYGASKLAGENYTAAYHTCYGMPVVCVRGFNNYGPRAHFGGDSGEVIPRFILKALGGEPPMIFGDGLQTRDFIYVRDCAEALVKIAATDSLVGEVVNLGRGEEIRILDLAQKILAAVGRTDLKPVHVDDRPGDLRRLWVKATKLEKATGFKPHVSPEEGLAKTVEFYRSLAASDPDFMARIKQRNWEPA